MKITDEVLRLDCTKGSYAYAVTGADGVTLIDTGFPGRGAAILAELAAGGVRPGDVRRVLLTHHDVDHIGNLAFLQEKTGCDIYISAGDYPCVMENKGREGVKRFMGALMKPKKPRKATRLEGDGIGGFAVIPTPGHTKGHTAYRFRNVLFIGDLARNKGGKPGLHPALITWNREALLASVAALPAGGAEFFCPAHGEPFGAAEWEAFAREFR